MTEPVNLLKNRFPSLKPLRSTETLILSKTTFKTAIAATTSYLLANWSHLEYPFYAVIGSIIVISSTNVSTLKLGFQRLFATTLGVIAGVIFSFIFGNNPWSLGLSVFFNFFLISYLNFPEAAKTGAYIPAIVILNHSNALLSYSWGRFVETLLGICVALLVNILVFPAAAGLELRQILEQILNKLEKLYQLVVNGALHGNYDRTTANNLKTQIIDLLQKQKPLWKEIKGGWSGEPPEKRINETWEFLIHRIWEHILTMENTIIARQQDVFWQNLAPEMEQLAQESSLAILALEKAIKSYKREVFLVDLETAVNQATRRLNSLPQIDQVDYAMDDLLRFLTFFYTMEEIARKLQKMAGLLN